MSEALAWLRVLGPTRLRPIAVSVMVAGTAWGLPASAQRASLLQGPLRGRTILLARTGDSRFVKSQGMALVASDSDSLRAKLDSCYPRDATGAAAPGESGEASALVASPNSALMAHTSLAIRSPRLATAFRVDPGAVGRMQSDSAAVAQHPERARFWQFAHVGMAVGAAVGLGYGLSQAPHCACGYFLGGTAGMVVAYTGAGSLFGFDGGSLAYLANRLVRHAASHAGNQ